MLTSASAADRTEQSADLPAFLFLLSGCAVDLIVYIALPQSGGGLWCCYLAVLQNSAHRL